MISGRRLRAWLPGIALVLAALCLRGPFAVVGPVLDRLETEYGVTPAALAVLTSLPLLCFAVLSPVAPRLAARLGVHRATLAGIAALTAGVALRLAGAPGLFTGTLLVAGGIAVVNVLLPAVVRAEYGVRSATVLGVCTAAISLSASVGAGAAAPVADLLGSGRWSLASWLLPVVAALAALAALTTRRPVEHAPAPPRATLTPMLRDRVGLAVTVYFGMQALTFYAMLTWLAQVLRDDAGVGVAASGLLLAGSAFLGAPAALVVPRLATRTGSQVGWAVAVAVPTGAALLGLLLAPAAAPVLWTLLYGIGTGASFPLAMTLLVERSVDVAQTGRLSAAAQTFGYLLAAAGPFALGVLRDVTGGWAAGHLLLLGALGVQTAAGLVAGRPVVVGGGVATRA